MLNGIANITAGSDFKGAAKKDNTAKPGRTVVYQMYDSHDSISISPAYSFLNRHNWKIKDITLEDEKLSITFTIAGYEFSTTIPLRQINQITDLEYTIVKKKDIDGIAYSVKVDFLVNLDRINYDEAGFTCSLSNMEIFFNRLIHLKMRDGLSLTERRVIEGMLEGLGPGLQSEFDLINNGLFIFIDKYFKIKINNNGNKANYINSVFVTRIRTFTESL